MLLDGARAPRLPQGAFPSLTFGDARVDDSLTREHGLGEDETVGVLGETRECLERIRQNLGDVRGERGRAGGGLGSGERHDAEGGKVAANDARVLGRRCARTISEETLVCAPSARSGERGEGDDERDSDPSETVEKTDGGTRRERARGWGRDEPGVRGVVIIVHRVGGTRGAAPRTRRASEASARGGQHLPEVTRRCRWPVLVRPP